MQRTTAAPRDDLTDGQVRDVLSGPVTLDWGADLLDGTGQFLEDVSADLVVGDGAGQVDYNAYRTVHRTCRVTLARQLQWGAVRLRLWVTLTGQRDGTVVKVFVGTFLLETPTRVASEDSEPRWEVDGYDLLGALNNAVGRTYQVSAGTKVTDAVVQAITDSGIVADTVLADAGGAPDLPSDRTWSVRDDVTWLRVVNDLLDAGGYRAIRADELGRFRASPYQPPQDRPSEWTYDVASVSLAPEAQVEEDLWQVPNTWVFYVDDPERGEPSEGTTQYTVTNQSDGPTSVDSRGYPVVAKRALDAADYASLVAQGDQQVERDRQVTTTAELQVAPNPLHDHFDIVTVDWPAGGLSGRWQVTGWTLPFGSVDDMTLTARQVS